MDDECYIVNTYPPNGWRTIHGWRRTHPKKNEGAASPRIMFHLHPTYRTSTLDKSLRTHNVQQVEGRKERRASIASLTPPYKKQNTLKIAHIREQSHTHSHEKSSKIVSWEEQQNRSLHDSKTVTESFHTESNKTLTRLGRETGSSSRQTKKKKKSTTERWSISSPRIITVETVYCTYPKPSQNRFTPREKQSQRVSGGQKGLESSSDRKKINAQNPNDRRLNSAAASRPENSSGTNV